MKLITTYITFLFLLTSISADTLRIGWRPNELQTDTVNEQLRFINDTISNEISLTSFKTNDDIISAISTGQIDVGIGDITITTNRNQLADFTVPIHKTSIQLAIKNDESNSIWKNVLNFNYPKKLFNVIFQPIVIEMCIWFSIYVICWAHVIWFLERGSECIDDNYMSGIGQSIRFCIVTISTVGYGNDIVKKLFSWVGVICLIMTGITFFSNFVAIFSVDLLTENQLLTSVNDLNKYKCVVKENTSFENRLNELQIVNYSTVNDESEFSEDHKIIVADSEFIKNWVDNHSNYYISNVELGSEYHAFATAFTEKGNELRKTLNTAILNKH